MSAYFISSIHTGVGKTLVSAAIAYQAQGKASAIKPIISGYDETEETDTSILLEAQGLDRSNIDAISPWRFTAPLSPHIAAELEGRNINSDELIAFCKNTIEQNQTTIIEGVGGLMVPINDKIMVIDWIKKLNIPTILVSSTYLGAINHTLLSLEALKQQNINVSAIVISESAQDSVGLETTANGIQPFIDPSISVITIPRLADMPWKNAPDLLSLIT